MATKRNSSESMSLNTLLSGSPSSSTDSSSNLDTQSTGSFFHDNGNTLGSLTGVSSILELPRRSLRKAKTEVLKRKKCKKSNSRSWLFCLCSRNVNSDAENNPPSLGQFLALERRAANENRKNQVPLICGPEDEFPLTQTITEPNSLFVNCNINIAPSRSIGSLANS